MGKVQGIVKRIELEIYNKDTGIKSPARFYTSDNEINTNILKGLARNLLGSVYGSTSVAGVSIEDAINPKTKTNVMAEVYIDGEAKQVPVKRLISFSTGYDKETGKEAENKPYVIELKSVVFEMEGKNGPFTLTKRAFKEMEGENKGQLKNSEAFRAIKDAILESGRKVTIDIGDREVDGQKQLYIKKIEPAAKENEKKVSEMEGPSA